MVKTKREDILKLYPSATLPTTAFHVSIEDADKIFKDKERWTCKDCLAIWKESRYHSGRVIISNEASEGLHLIGLSNE